ncbi:MAG TPA: hypothetical protein PKC40_14755, partial [Saprospiraceae bacterium]|nr:hypothetical protein [Saprospiraceae bacterium]
MSPSPLTQGILLHIDTWLPLKSFIFKNIPTSKKFSAMFFELSIRGIILRFYLMMLVVIVAGFSGQ